MKILTLKAIPPYRIEKRNIEFLFDLKAIPSTAKAVANIKNASGKFKKK